jgi:hypothetical protein
MNCRTVLLYVAIPMAVTLLLILQFAHGSFQRINDLVMRGVGALMFSKFGVLPLPLIHIILLGHLVMTVVMITSVYNYESGKKPSISAPLETQIQHHAKVWRAQRNLYLTCLSLSLWYALNSVYSLKVQLARLGVGNTGRQGVKQTKRVIDATNITSASADDSESAPAVADETELAPLIKQRPPATNPKAKKAT